MQHQKICRYAADFIIIIIAFYTEFVSIKEHFFYFLSLSGT